MLGAIIGDIAGSRFEWDNLKSKEFDLLTHSCARMNEAFKGTGSDAEGGTYAVR